MYRSLIAFAITATIVSAQQPKAEPLYYPTKVRDKRVTEIMLKDKNYQTTETVAKVEPKGNGLRVTVEALMTKGSTDPIPPVLFVYDVSAKGVVVVEKEGKKLPVAIEQLKLPAKVGYTWTAEPTSTLKIAYKILASEEVEVPAGKFKTIPVLSKMVGPGSANVTSTSWYAPNVGMVKMNAKLPDYDLTEVLKSFTPGK